MNERDAYIVLNIMEKVGPVVVRALIERLGSASAIMEADAGALREARGVGPELAAAIVRQRETLDPAREQALAESLGARIVTQIDDEYPKPLLEIHDPPLALAVKGTLTSGDRRAIAIVGTRRPSHYGRDVAEQLAAQLCRTGFTVISGLAEGIDTAAHRGALAARGRTLGVLGGALDCLYPSSNRELAEAMSGQGAVISEFPFGRRPDKTTFPMRNRIVSGLSMGIVVVEAGLTSGAMITARQAMEQGRTVFAVPGRIDSSRAAGCHALIRDGAVLVTGVDDILAEFEFLIPPSRDGARARGGAGAPALNDAERTLVEALSGGERDVDSLIRECNLKPAEAGSLLLGLEMKRVVRMLPGRTVALARQEV